MGEIAKLLHPRLFGHRIWRPLTVISPHNKAIRKEALSSRLFEDAEELDLQPASHSTAAEYVQMMQN